MTDDDIRRLVRTVADAAPAGTDLAGSVVRRIPRRRRRRQSLVAAGVVLALTGTAVAVVESQNRPDQLTFATGSEARYTCGGIGPSFAADAIRSPLGAENADDPATAVLRAHTTPQNSPYVQSNGWRQLARTDNEVIWTTGPEFGYYGVKRFGDTWKFAYSGGRCEFKRVLPESFDAHQWSLAEPPEPTARSVKVLVKHLKGEDLPTARPIVEVHEHAVSITLALERPESAGRPEVLTYRETDDKLSAYSVDIGEPIGGRQLLDGSIFPAIPARTVGQKDSECGFYPLHLDHLEIRANASTRIWPADYCPAGHQRFSLLTEGRHAELPLTAVPAGATRRNGRTPYAVTIPAVSPGTAAIVARGSACGYCVVAYTPAFVVDDAQPTTPEPPSTRAASASPRESTPSPAVEPSPSSASSARVTVSVSPASAQVGEPVKIVATLQAPHGAPLDTRRYELGDGQARVATAMNDCGGPTYTHTDDIEYAYSEPGTYTITVYMKASGCRRETDEATGSATVTVHPKSG